VAFRLSYLDLNDGSTKGGKETNYTLGVNWYLRPKIRIMFNYVHARVKDRDDPEIEDGRSDIIMSRIQLAF